MTEIPGPGPESQEPRQPTRREIHRRSLSTAHNLLRDITVQQQQGAYFEPYGLSASMGTLAQIEEKRSGATVYRPIAERYEALDEKFIAAEFYLDASSAGDTVAFERLGAILQTEQATLGGGFIEEDEQTVLGIVVERCAEQAIPADTWIDNYSMDPTHAAQLKLSYFKHQQVATHAGIAIDEGGLAIGRRYRDEVTEEFFTSEDMEGPAAVYTAVKLWNSQEDQEVRDRIFDKVYDICNSEPMDYSLFQDVTSLAEIMLHNPEQTTSEQARWIAEFTERGREELIEAGEDAFLINHEVGNLQLGLALYFGESQEQIVERIDALTTRQLQTDIPDESSGVGSENYFRNREQVIRLRDNYLHGVARLYAANGDFATAKNFLDEIGGETSRQSAIADSLEQTTTPEQVDMLAPDEVALMLDPNAGEIFDDRKVILEGDPEKIRNLAFSKIGSEGYAAGKAIDSCVSWMRAHDEAEGRQLESEILHSLEERESDPRRITDLAKRRYQLGDEQALQTLLQKAEEQEDPLQRLTAYADIALLTAPAEGETRDIDWDGMQMLWQGSEKEEQLVFGIEEVSPQTEESLPEWNVIDDYPDHDEYDDDNGLEL